MTSRHLMGIVAVGLVALVVGAGPTPAAGAANVESSPSVSAPIRGRVARLPLAFEENRGQTDASVRFLARCPRMTAFFTPAETVLALDVGCGDTADELLRIRFLGANHSPAIDARGALPGRSNYFIGADPAKWLTDVPNFDGVVVREVYSGIDVCWRGDESGRLTYDLVVGPGADPACIEFALGGARDVAVAEDGSLRARTALGELRATRPFAFQTIGGERRPVDAAFGLSSDGHVRFDVGRHDARHPLVIDPSLTYSTFLGGSAGEWCTGVAVDGSGAAYVTGRTGSASFPTQSALQGASGGGDDAFVTKINAAGTAMVYSTYLGGSGYDGGNGGGIAVDGNGVAYVTGETQSTDFPLQSPLQSTFAGSNDAFVSALNASGSGLVYSTYLGGSGSDYVYGIAIDASGAAYVCGHTGSTNFPTVAALQSSLSGSFDGFVAKISAYGSGLAYATYLGGSGIEYCRDIAVDSSGAAYVTGWTRSSNFPTQSPLQGTYGGGDDAYLAKISSSGSALVYSTYLGGSSLEQGYGVAVDSGGAAYVAGGTASSNFPTTGAYQPASAGNSDAFLAKVNASGTGLAYSTYLGAGGLDVALGIALDSSGAATIVGITRSTGFPTASPAQASYGGGVEDGFVAKFDATGASLVFSTFLGGSGTDQPYEVAVGSTGAAYVQGWTTSTDFPLQSPVQGTLGGSNDVFLAKYPLTTSGGGGGGPPPAAPINLVANYVEGSGVSLAWDDVSTDETGFRVERRPAGYAFALLTTTGANATSAIDTALFPNTTFVYRVRAFNANGSSAWSNEASITTSGGVPIPVPPRAPTQLVALPGEDLSGGQVIDLAWTDNSTDEVLFDIERAEGGSAFRSTAHPAADATGHSDEPVHPGWTYSYRVRALSLQGPSPWSNSAAATPAGTIDVTVTSGRLTDLAKLKHDKLKLAASYGFPASAPTDATLDPVANGLELQLGAANAAVPVSIGPADPAWKVKTRKGKPTLATWKSAKGASPKVTVVVDLVRHVLTAIVSGAEFTAAPTPLVRVLLASGTDGGAHASTWTEGKAGRWRLAAAK